MMLIDHEKVDNCIEMRRSQSSHVPIIRYQLKNITQLRCSFIMIIVCEMIFCICNRQKTEMFQKKKRTKTRTMLNLNHDNDH
ncbi:hypothetical protein BLOT_007665 [Blomia tropicalis]|nr:hypothetical protein BLOT_007665 [Blomia tropicalis]